MATYADMASVLTILNLDAPTTAQQNRLDALDLAISAQMERDLGRSFGPGSPTPRTETGDGLGVSDVLPLRIGLRSVTSITVGGTVLDPSAYRLLWADRDGNAWAVQRTDDALWDAAEIAITGVWADQPYEDVPPEIAEAVTVLVAATYKIDEAGPTGVIGPDGMPVQTRNPWNDDRVRRAIEAYRLTPVVL